MITPSINPSLIPGMPAPIANASIPLERQLKDRQWGATMNTVHTLNPNLRSAPIATTVALINSAVKADLLYDHFGSLFWSVIAPINNIAIMEIQEAYAQLSHSPFFRQAIKLNAKTTLSRIEKYEKAVLRNMQRNLLGDHRQFWLDYSDEYYERLRPHINILRQSVLQQLTRFQEQDRDLKSHLVVSNAMLNFSIGMYDKFFAKVKEHFAAELQDAYLAARLGYVQSTWLHVVDPLCRSNAGIYLYNDPQVKLAMQVIERKCVNQEMIADICKQAIDYNPEIEEELANKPENPYSKDSFVSSTMSQIFR